MARVDSLNNFLTDVANSIRTKKGTTDTILASNFDTEIESIETDPNLQSKSITITENGTQNVTADEGYDGLSDVSVTTNVPTGGDVPTKGFVVNKWNSNGYPTEITLIGFSGNLSSWSFGSNNSSQLTIIGKYLSKITIPNEITIINVGCFQNCNKLESINLPNGLTIIYGNAFRYCTNLALTSLPDTITNLEANCFQSCTNLALTKLPNSLTYIGNECFRNCTNLALTSLPSRLTSIGNYAFQNCTNLALTSLPDTITNLEANCFQSCTNLALTKLPNSLTYIGNECFRNCTNLALTSLPSRLTSIGNYAFQNCTNLALTELPSTLTSIGSFAFGSTTNNIKTISETVTSIGPGAFYSSSITQISVNFSNIRGEGTSVGYRGLFENCQKMIACWVGSNIVNLYRYPFNTCISMKKLFIDKPRATVEGFAGYSYHFSNNTNTTFQIICNDDEGFMTKEEFDAIDWSTYTEEV